MASVKRRSNSRFWVCCYRSSETGKRIQVSSKTADRHEAMQLAWTLEGLGRNYNRERALRIVNDIATANGRQMIDDIPCQNYFAQWRKAREPDWSDSTRKCFHAIEKRFLEYFPNVAVGSVSRQMITDYRDHMMSLGRSRKTIMQHMKYIRRVFQSALESERIPENPVEGVVLLSPRPSAKQPFTMQQFRGLLNKTDGEWHRLILVAGLTGQRLMDVLALKHEDIDRETNTIRFRRRKNKDFHYVPLHAAIKETIPAEIGCIFPDLSALPKTGSRSVSAQFRETILPMIGIVQEYASNAGGNKRVTEYSFHSLRHMLSTELNRLGASQETRMFIVGHDDRKVSAGYTHMDMETAQVMLARVSV